MSQLECDHILCGCGSGQVWRLGKIINSALVGPLAVRLPKLPLQLLQLLT